MNNIEIFQILSIIVVFIASMICLFIAYLIKRRKGVGPSIYIRKSCFVKKDIFLNKKVYTITPKKVNRTDIILLYIHGGSYIGGLYKEHWRIFRNLCNDLGCTIIAPDYPLAPKYTYIDVFNFMEPLYKKIIDMINTNNLILAGDSAGGGLALALAQKIGEQDINQPNKLILISPWLDLSMSNPEIDGVQKRDKVLNKAVLKIAGELYAGKDGMKKYLVNPINGPFNKLKNVTIFTRNL